MSKTWLRCSYCEEQFFFPELFWMYWTGPDDVSPSMNQSDINVSVIKTPIWCHVCNQPSYAERVPSLREFEKAIAIVSRELEKGTKIAVDDDLPMRSITELKFLAQSLNLHRKGACLCCGGYQYTKLYDDSNNLIKLKHQFCEGYFQQGWLIFSAVWSHMTIRWYDLNGKFLLEKCEGSPYPHLMP